MNLSKRLTTNGNSFSWGAFLCFFVLFIYTHQIKFDGPTPVSRLDLLHCLVTEHTFRIDSVEQNTSDKAHYQGHWYSDKAPGTSVLALPFFLAATKLQTVFGNVAQPGEPWLFQSWVSCAGALGLFAALGATCLLKWLSVWTGGRAALVTTMAVFLGGMPLPYSTVLFSHALAVGLIAFAMWALMRPGEVAGETAEARHQKPGIETSDNGDDVRCRRVNWWDLLGGLAAGWALASEYTSGIVIVGLFLWLLSQNRRRAIAFGVAAMPPLLLIPLYSWACFGNPFVLPYSLNESFPEMKHGLYAIKWPNPEVALKLLFGPARGLLFWCPFLAIAGIGYRELFRKSKSLFWLTFLGPVLQVLVISGRTWDWPAGPAFGPRYFAPMLPLLALPCAFGARRIPKIALVLGVYSVEITTLATLTDASPDFDWHPNPLFDLNIPRLIEGKLSYNLGMALGLPPNLSVGLFYAILLAALWWLWTRLPDKAVHAAAQRRASEQTQDNLKITDDPPVR